MTPEQKLERLAALLHPRTKMAAQYGEVTDSPQGKHKELIWLDGPFLTIESATEQLERNRQDFPEYPKTADAHTINTVHARAFREVIDLTQPSGPPTGQKADSSPATAASSTQQALADALQRLIAFLQERDGEKTFKIPVMRACMAALAQNAHERQGPPR
jgi:hypothetical protein